MNKALTFKSFLQVQHLVPLVAAISGLPLLRTLSLISAPEALPDMAFHYSPRPQLQIESLIIDTQVSAF